MITSTTNNTCELSDAAIFNIIVQAANSYWIKQDGRRYLYFETGNMLAWGKRWAAVFLGYNPENHKIHLHTIVADLVFKIPNRFDALIFQPSAVRGRSQSRYDPENFVVVMESNCKCPPDKEEIPERVGTLFTDFKSMLNDKLLYAALQAAKVHFLGAPVDVFEKE